MLGAFLRRLLHGGPPRRASDFPAAYRFYEQDRLDEAQQACDALSGANAADVAFLRGLIEQKRGDFRAAAAAMAAAVASRPLEPTFHDVLAAVLVALGEHRRALEHVERFLACAPKDDPRRAAACATAGRSCLALDDNAGAQAWFERARAADPLESHAALLVSGALYESFRAGEARAALTRVRSAGYALRLRRTLMFPAVYGSRDEIDETRERFSRELDELLESSAERVTDPVAEIGVTPFYLAYHDRNNAELMRKVCRAVRRAYHVPQDADPGRQRGDRLRIGFVSRHFYAHSVARATLGFIRDLPRDRFVVEVFAVAPVEDDIRTAVEQAADHYVRLPADLDRVRRTIAAARLDALVFTDIGMEPLTYFLALSRLAPLQVTTWGHSETSGIDTVDWYLSAHGVEIAEAQRHYSEKLLRPKAFFLGGYERPPAAVNSDRSTLGLPSDRHLYACLQPAFKLHPDVDIVFNGVLDRDARAEILLAEPKPGAARMLKERFARTLGRNAARLRFLPAMPFPRYLATLACADVALDPLHFGGCNSSVETLGLGVPLVTLPGTHLYGRFTYALYTELELRECIATDTDDYVDKALRLATEPQYRERVSAQLQERARLMFDRTDVTHAYGRAIAEALS